MADTTPPNLNALAFTPNVVNAAAGPQTVTVTVSISDQPAGLMWGDLQFRSPSGGQAAGTWFDASNRIAGNEFNGEYRNTVTIPQYAEQGQWRLANVYLQDRATNAIELQTADLQNNGFPVALSQQGPGETSPPDLPKLAFGPTAVDATMAPQAVTVRVLIRDQPAGLNWGDLLFRSPSGRQAAGTWFDASNRISGDEFQGVYRSTVTIHRYAERGKWRIANVYLQDRARNSTTLDTQALQNDGLPVTLGVTGKQDVKAPSLAAVDFTPTMINVANGPQAVNVRIRVTDQLAGLNWGDLLFRSSSGEQAAGTWFDASNRIAGNDLNGEYQNTVTIPQYAEQGQWRLANVYLQDRARNSTTLDTQAIQSKGFPVSLSVT